jgi:hypothetical protein
MDEQTFDYQEEEAFDYQEEEAFDYQEEEAFDYQEEETFDYQEEEMCDLYEDFDINPYESISNVFTDVRSEITDTNTDVSTSSRESTVWRYFHKRPSDAPGHNVCKTCLAKYETTTSVSTLRKHLLNSHQIQVPPKRQKTTTRMNPFNEQEQIKHTKYLIQWIICDLQPFNVVGNKYFKEFINYFCPRYIIPTRKHVKNLIVNAFNNRRTKIIKELDQIEGRCSLTADIWTSINQKAYLGITIHYIDLNWGLRNFLLDIIPFSVRHTGKNIAQEIMRVLEEFQISNKIIALTTDNESAMVVCGKELSDAFNNELSLMNFSHYRCAAHVLNLGVKQGLQLVSSSVNKVRELMIKIKNSTLLCDKLRTYCEVEGMNYLKPILDVETRWNSTYYMLERLGKLQPALALLVASQGDVRDLYPNEDEWIAIKVNNPSI